MLLACPRNERENLAIVIHQRFLDAYFEEWRLKSSFDLLRCVLYRRGCESGCSGLELVLTKVFINPGYLRKWERL